MRGKNWPKLTSSPPRHTLLVTFMGGSSGKAGDLGAFSSVNWLHLSPGWPLKPLSHFPHHLPAVPERGVLGAILPVAVTVLAGACQLLYQDPCKLSRSLHITQKPRNPGTLCLSLSMLRCSLQPFLLCCLDCTTLDIVILLEGLKFSCSLSLGKLKTKLYSGNTPKKRYSYS